MTNQTNTGPVTIEVAKAAALAELNAYRERKRLEREALAVAEQTVEDEIAETIRQRRAEEAKRVELEAARQKHMADREARLAALWEQEREARLNAEPQRRIAEHPARRVALKLRERMLDNAEFATFLADIRGVNFKQLQIELARIPQDEQAAALHRQRKEAAKRLAAEASTLPAPESDAEAEILARHGFSVPLGHRRQAELNAGVL